MFVNRSVCFVTIHRKVQHPVPSDRKITEFHIRKVRDVETGGEPTPIEEPVRFEMNTSRTGFRMNKTQRDLFISKDIDGGDQSDINFPRNDSFLSQ